MQDSKGQWMPRAHLFLFSDACRSDWLTDGHDDEWHTIVSFLFQSDPALQQRVERGDGHEAVLGQDTKYVDLVGDLQSRLPSGTLRKWKTGPGYRANFYRSFTAIVEKHRPFVSACSFQEKTLRHSKQALLNSYNLRLGGIEGRGVGFEEFMDDRGRKQMKHAFVCGMGANLGYHELQAPENQMVVLLLLSWFVADQFAFYFKDIVKSGRYGFDSLGLTVVSDKISGDDERRPKSEQILRNLIDPQHEGVPLVLTRSSRSDVFSGDLIVDNLAGWLTSAMDDPAGEHAGYAKELIPTGVWNGWHQLTPSVSKLESTPAISRLACATAVSPA